MTAATLGLRLAEEPGADFGDMLELEAGHFQFIRGGAAGPIWPGRDPLRPKAEIREPKLVARYPERVAMG